MSPFLAQVILVPPCPNGSGWAAPPSAGARYGRTVSCRLRLPVKISSLLSGETSNDVKLIKPDSDTCCHVPSGSASRYNLLSAEVSELAYSHFPSGEKRTVPPIG